MSEHDTPGDVRLGPDSTRKRAVWLDMFRQVGAMPGGPS